MREKRRREARYLKFFGSGFLTIATPQPIPSLTKPRMPRAPPFPLSPPQHGRKVLPNALPSLARDSCSPGITDHSSWPPKLIEITKRPDKKFRQGFIGTPVGEREREQATGSLVPSLVWGGRG